MHKAPVRESCLFEGEMGESRCVILVKIRAGVDPRSSISILPRIVNRRRSRKDRSDSYSLMMRIRLANTSSLRSTEKTTSLLISFAASNEKNRNSLEKRAI